jgi:hypothetical protein
MEIQIHPQGKKEPESVTTVVDIEHIFLLFKFT